MTENLNKEIQNTTDFLTRLESEQADLGAKMAIAADDADSSALITLAHRRNDLPIEILSARIRLTKLHLQLDESRIPELQAEAAKFYEPIQEEIRKRDAAVLALAKLQGAASGANEDLREIKNRIGERRRSIDLLLAQARNAKIAPAAFALRNT